MRAVSNASPLIALAKADLIGVLPQLFDHVVVPNAVAEEIAAGGKQDPLTARVLDLPWLHRVTLDPPLSPLAGWQLGSGEAEVLEWARTHGETIALLDDRAARKAAAALGVRMVGTLGILARAVTRGIIESFDAGVVRLKSAGLFVDEKVIEAVKRQLDR